jgi:shikimate dehydrogenase
MRSTGVSNPGCAANRIRSRIGNDSTHCPTGTRGITARPGARRSRPCVARRTRGKTRAALLGAGGAIAFALAEAGVAALSVHDLDPAKAVALAADLQHAHPALAARAGPPRRGEFDLLVNATPTGMKPDHPLPWPVDSLASGAIVGDVTTKPEVTLFVAAARERGCAIVSGRDMVEGQLGLLFRVFGFDVDPLT